MGKGLHWDRYGFLALGLCICLFFTGRNFQVNTGDETRYLMYSYSIIKYGHLIPTDAQWKQIYFDSTHMQSRGIPYIAGGIGHPIYLVTLLSPIALFFKLSGLRLVAMLAGVFGLFNILGLMRRVIPESSYQPILAVFLTAFSIPLLPYLNQIYMEIFLFAFTAWGWKRIHTAPRTLQSNLLTAIIILAIPFIHLRGAVVGATLFIIFLIKIYNERTHRIRYQYCSYFIFLAVLALGLLSSLNLAIYGDISGSVNTARPPPPWELPQVIAMQLFNVRHGFFAYSPMWILGYAGLTSGTAMRNKICIEGLILSAIAIFTSIGVNPGECWPARFWVLSIPMLAIGLSYWIYKLTGFGSYLVTVMLFLFTMLNTAFFWLDPNSLLSNRQTAVTYQHLFEKTGFANFGIVLPVEIPGGDQSSLANLLGGAAIIMLAFLTFSVFKPKVSWVTVVMLLVVVDLARVARLPGSAFRATFLEQSISISLQRPKSRVLYVQFKPSWQSWSVPPAWPYFTVNTKDIAGRSGTWMTYADQVVSVTCPGPVADINVGTADAKEVRGAMDTMITLYQSQSFIRKILEAQEPNCTERG